ncbi:MAG: hypothetical protein ACLFSA_11610 [Spirochaetaceae bacterium]
MGSKFVPITRKVSLIIIISLAIGLGAVVFYFAIAVWSFSLFGCQDEELEVRIRRGHSF